MDGSSQSPPPSTTAKLFLLSIPPEIIHRILEYLDDHSLVVCQQVCHKFRSIVRRSSALQYQLQLAASGAHDGPKGPLSAAERLDTLRRYNDAWRQFEWTKSTSERISAGGLYELYGNVLAQSLERHRITFKQLPSEIRGIQERNWELKFDFHIRDFGIDPAQDALFVFQTHNLDGICRIHIRSLSTGEVHPLAERISGILEYPIASADLSFTIQPHRDYIGVIIEPTENEVENLFIIWNWKTGVVEMRLAGMDVASFSFLDEDHVMVASLSGRLETYSKPSLLVYNFKEVPSEETDLGDEPYVCAFYMPEMDEETVSAYMLIRSDPAPSWSPSPDLHVPFHISHLQRLFVVSLVLIVGQRIEAFDFFIPSHSLLPHVKEARIANTSRDVCWEDWGLHGSHMSQVSPRRPIWVCYVFGMRYTTLVFDETLRPKIKILDFHPKRLASGLMTTNSKLSDSWSVVSETETVPGRWISGPVTTTLQYLSKTVQIPPEVNLNSPVCMMISEDAVIVMETVWARSFLGDLN
ncbi:hypothetical protein EVG20_g2079 [Dentipellis fragilis]|uniref:F-box domain-containing protein n=1 Tax=Dentipellis fragilis TaxID=205917 RepID=A0A4Y9Z7S5_9AGAM|nr:hypothetical protein EVG20_g2079 [Dentipellis fragilis]